MIDMIDKKAAALKEKILSAKSAWDGNGTAHYVSMGGCDDADGLTPETAWKTLDKVNSFDGFNKGDAVLFERGGEWRGQLRPQSNVAYSAYGEGDKPIITGSIKNYAVASEWTETDVKNVWRHCDEIQNDVGLVVFDHGEAWSFKMVVGTAGFTGDLTQMTEDLQMYHSLDDRHVYLYSDKGNPAVRFKDIEMAEKRHVVLVEAENVLIDNLFIRYGGSHGVAGLNLKGLTVKNCVLAWIGGSLQGVDPQAKTRSTTRYGNAIEIYVACSDYTIENCWIYQAYDAGVTHQFKNFNPTTVKHENVLYRNNLIERCTYSIEYFLDQYDAPEQIMNHVEMTGNICRLAGYGFGHQRPDKSTPAHIKSWDAHGNRASDFVIHDNIFDRSREAVFQMTAGQAEWLPKAYRNLFVQDEGGKFGQAGVCGCDKQMFDGSVFENAYLADNAFCIVKK